MNGDDRQNTSDLLTPYDVEPAPEHKIRLLTADEEGRARSTCSCGHYTSIVCQRQKAYKLGQAHAAYHQQKWKSVL